MKLTIRRPATSTMSALPIVLLAFTNATAYTSISTLALTNTTPPALLPDVPALTGCTALSEEFSFSTAPSPSAFCRNGTELFYANFAGGTWQTRPVPGLLPPSTPAGLRTTADDRGSAWLLLQAGGASAGNSGGTSNLVYKFSPGSRPPTVFYNQTGATLKDIRWSPLGLFARSMNVGSPVGGGTTLATSAVLQWGADGAPPAPIPNTILPRMLQAIAPPTAVNPTMFIVPYLTPLTLEFWDFNGTWNRTQEIPLTLTRAPVYQILSDTETVWLLGPRAVIRLPLNTLKEELFYVPPPALTLRSMAYAQWSPSPSPTATGTQTPRQTPTSSASATTTSTPSPSITATPTISYSPTPTSTSTLGSSPSATPTSSVSPSPSPPYASSPTPTYNPTTPPSQTITGTRTPTSTLGMSVSASTTPTAQNASIPAANVLTPDAQVAYGVGFGIGLPLLLAAAAVAALMWWARRCPWHQRRRTPRFRPQGPRRPGSAATNSNVLHIVQNPQHTALSAEAIRLTEELQAARQASVSAQRAALGAQSQQVMVVKRTFAPIMLRPGTSV